MVATATVRGMREDEADFRCERLQAAADKLGGYDQLGQALGYKNGAYVWQMIERRRPISEKTIAKVEGVRGMRGWFDRRIDRQVDEPPPVEIEAALPAVLARLPGLDPYRAGQVLRAFESAMGPAPPLETIEKDLLRWLTEDRSKRPIPGAP